MSTRTYTKIPRLGTRPVHVYTLGPAINQRVYINIRVVYSADLLLQLYAVER